MKVISSNFLKQKDNIHKNDGLKFEKLIENILNLEFDHLNWEGTKQSWDGARDFVGKKDGAFEVWAECKMYQKTLQLAIISKTLVMAINYQINRIIIFSWSKLTPGAIKELANFSSTSGIHIQIFDDDLLEDLILKHINNKVIKEFFPDISNKDLKELTFKPEIEQFFSTDIQLDSNQLDHSEDISNPRSNQIHIDTPCVFQITVYPNTIEPVNILIDLSKILEKEHILGILNKEKLDIDKNYRISRNLSSGEIYSLKINFAPSQKGHQRIPVCDIFIKNKKLQTTSVEFNVDRLTRPILVGENVIQALNDFHAKVSNNNLIYTTVINGLGGVGKSRFLEECISKLLKENYRICKLDGKSIQCKNINFFAAWLLTQLWKLPNPIVFKDEISTLRLQISENDTDYFSSIYEVIKKCTISEQTVFDEIKDKIYQFIEDGFLKQTRIAILIDNVQSLDKESVLLVRKLIEQTGLPGQNVILLTFNVEELIYSHEATSFYQYLKEKLPCNSNGLFFTLNEFSENELILFVDAHLKNTNEDLTFSKQYPLLFKLICEFIQPRPLDLYLFFYLLVDKGAVKLDDGMFFINDFEIFNNILRGVEKTTEGILTQRLNILQSNKEALEVLLLLTYFGEMNIYSMTEKLKIKYETIENLCKGCWIKISASENITFYHPKIERFIIGKEHYLLKTNEFSTLLNNNIDLQKFPLINFAVSCLKDEILPTAVVELQKLSVLNARNKLFATKIYNYVTDKFSNVDPGIYLGAIQKICSLMSENSTVAIIEKLSNFNEILKDYIPKKAEAKSYFQVIRQYASYLCAKDPYKSISVIKEGISRLNRFKNDFSEDVFDFIFMNLKNRLSYCYRTIRNQDKATEIGEEALYIAKKIGNIPFICLCYIDLGYIFLGTNKDKNKLIEYWSEAVKLFNSNKKNIYKEDISIALGVMIAEAYLYAVKNNSYEKAINKTEEVINISKEHFYMHSEILGILAKTIFELKLQQSTYNRIIALADNLIDRCLVSYDSKNQSKGYHLKAIALCKQNGKNNEAYIHFKYGLELLENREYLSVSDEALVWDAALFSKRQKNDDESLVFSPEIRNKMSKYSSFEKFLEDNGTANLFMVFADSEYNIPV